MSTTMATVVAFQRVSDRSTASIFFSLLHLNQGIFWVGIPGAFCVAFVGSSPLQASFQQLARLGQVFSLYQDLATVACCEACHRPDLGRSNDPCVFIVGQG